jgi:hypothetical protein
MSQNCCHQRAYCSSPRWPMSMELTWNNTDRRKPKNFEKNLSQCHSVHRKSHMDWSGRVPGPPRSSAHTNLCLDSHTVLFPISHIMLYSISHYISRLIARNVFHTSRCLVLHTARHPDRSWFQNRSRMPNTNVSPAGLYQISANRPYLL